MDAQRVVKVQPTGVIIVDKPTDCTSFDVVRQIKKLYNCKKVGHTGTLDPIATGVLPIALGKATKLSSVIMSFPKVYDVWATLGYATDSHDRVGETIAEKPYEHITEESLKAALQEFTGTITQVAPMFSAVKHKGKPLYYYAHKGIDIPERKIRTCHIHSIDLLEFSAPKFRIRVHCSQGTYVRSLVHDVANHLESAAVVSELRREAVGSLTSERSVSLATIANTAPVERSQYLLSLTQAVSDLPGINLSDAQARRIKTGRPVHWSEVEQGGATSGLVKIVTQDHLVAIASAGQDVPIIKTTHVF